jgi:hypothetical protein
MRFLGQYVLIGQTPVLEPDLLKWSIWMADADRIVFQTEVPGGLVSTVFLGLDHQWGKGPPLLFETMIFRDGETCECERCSTWLQAEAQHLRVVVRITAQKTFGGKT